MLFFDSIQEISNCLVIGKVFRELPDREGRMLLENQLLFQYAEEGNTEELKKITANGANLNAVNEAGLNALMLASMNGHASAVRVLLDAGASIHSVNRSGFTPLILAARNCKLDAVKVLLQHSSHSSDRKSPSVVALYLANSLETTGCLEVARLIRANPS